ncbi:hypothetical protein [Pseudonocardia parietis]|uniref:Uncharacterized protein n=1 Tax=Pseudonocardia parietis TaxID=570936 RepID=A0ABS4W6S0_9PSEU|nr:hypothetical protein [Pseudonocardia parietis]MBP2371912.1 hypothetical protein [Pseudonocardia parietis]
MMVGVDVTLRRTALAPLLPRLATGADRHPGTNGWVSSWGTNAHGEIAGCPPPHLA